MNLLNRFLNWLDRELPIPCPLCKKWVSKKTMRRTQHHLAGWMLICPKCYRDLYGGGDNGHNTLSRNEDGCDPCMR